MARLLVTSGPTRQYLDPVRYLTNASSGRMGAAIAAAAIQAGHEVVLVTGPVAVEYPQQASIVPVVSTEDMLAACCEVFPSCDGMIAVAAPCDYRPASVAEHKIRKSGDALQIELIETPDIVATAAKTKRASQWIVAFALETEDQHLRAMQKLERKKCDLIVLNGPQAIHAADTQLDILDKAGQVVLHYEGDKPGAAVQILRTIEKHLISKDS